jgi:hypothetical protein
LAAGRIEAFPKGTAIETAGAFPKGRAGEKASAFSESIAFREYRSWQLFIGTVPTSEQQWNSHEKSGKANVGCRL